MDSIDKINILLSKHGMSGAELSRAIGVSNSVYSQWNTKTTKPSKRSLSKIASVFGVDILDVMADSEEAEKEKPAQVSGLSVEEIKDAFRGKSFEELTEILAALTDELKNTK